MDFNKIKARRDVLLKDKRYLSIDKKKPSKMIHFKSTIKPLGPEHYICDDCTAIVRVVKGKRFGSKIYWFCDKCEVDGCRYIKDGTQSGAFKLITKNE